MPSTRELGPPEQLRETVAGRLLQRVVGRKSAGANGATVKHLWRDATTRIGLMPPHS